MIKATWHIWPSIRSTKACCGRAVWISRPVEAATSPLPKVAAVGMCVYSSRGKETTKTIANIAAI